VDVNESYIARVKERQKVTATLDAYPNWQIPSHVRTIIPTADRQKATVKVRVRLTSSTRDPAGHGRQSCVSGARSSHAPQQEMRPPRRRL